MDPVLDLAAITETDFGLDSEHHHCSDDYVLWCPTQPEANLDGYFSAADLHAIADHMQAHTH